MSKHQNFKVLLFIILVITVIIDNQMLKILYFNYFSKSFEYSPTKNISRVKAITSNSSFIVTTKQMKIMTTVLFYGTYFGLNYGEIQNNVLELSNGYSVKYLNHNIILTTNISEIVNAGFVLFHLHDTRSRTIDRLKKSKKSNQIWALHTMECPNSKYLKANFDDSMDVMINYMSGTVFPNKYGTFVKTANSSFNLQNYKNLCKTAKKKKRMGIMVTNCATHRINLIRKFMKYFNVTVIGKCSKLFGPKMKCNDCTHILKDIKFYLAFENNICKDYVTEKYFRNPWMFNAVPITYNGANLTEYVPYKTAININDFNSFEKLVLFIEQIDDDCDKWADYFKWQTEYQIHEAEIFELLVDFVKKFKNRKDELIDIIKKNPFHKPSKALSRGLCRPYNNYFDKTPYKL